MFISTLAFIPFALAASNWTVYTSNGPITGHTTGDVVEYLGIPYAEPPLGSLRFMPPQKLTRSRPYEAAHWGYDCARLSSRTFNYTYLTAQAPAILAAFTGETGSLQSEDCLTLNIWSKPARSRDQPVFVFFHGGRFAGGNTNTPFWNGRHFAAAEDIIVITVNYRTNILGFPGSCTPGSECIQNPGLRDQRLAVEWIRDNIAAFGGDAQKIVIAGQSAGAVSVDYWAYAYKQDPIVAGLIMQSGSALSFPLNSPEHTTAAWRAVVRAVGCDGVDEIYCMQQKDWEDIRTAAAEVKPDNSTNTNPLRSTPAFYPVVDNETVFGDYPALNKKGLFAKLPILIGHNDKEEGYYALSSLSNGINALPTETEITGFHLSSFTCPIAAQANARTAHNVPVWQYRYFANWTNAQLYTSTNNNSNGSSALATLRGAYHGSELFMVFGTSGDVTGIEPSEAEKQMARTIQRAWAVFCHRPHDGLSREMQWPMSSRGELVRLGYRDSPTPDFVRARVYNHIQCQ